MFTYFINILTELTGLGVLPTDAFARNSIEFSGGQVSLFILKLKIVIMDPKLEDCLRFFEKPTKDKSLYYFLNHRRAV